MTRTFLIFGNIEGKLEVLRVECGRCQRKGRYSVRKLIEKYGRNANMMKWRNQLNDDCPRRDAPQLRDRCEPDLPRPAKGAVSRITIRIDRGSSSLSVSPIPRAL